MAAKEKAELRQKKLEEQAALAKIFREREEKRIHSEA